MTERPAPVDEEARLDLARRVEAALAAHVRPELLADGNDVELVGVDADRIVQVRMSGACQGCSPSIMPLIMEIEAKLKPLVPEVRFVEAVP